MSNPISPKFKTEWFAVLLIIVSFGLAWYFYQNFPAQVPTHWNIQGEVDGYSSAALAAWMLPAVILGMYLLFLFMPYLDPKKEQYQKFAKTYHQFKDLIIAFMFILYFMTGANGLGYKIDIGFYMPLMIGILFVVIGYLLKKVKMNWFMGIKTPWTLSSETVWDKTNKLGANVFMVAGVLLAATVLVSPPVKIILFVVALFAMIAALPIYSYWLYGQERKIKK